MTSVSVDNAFKLQISEPGNEYLHHVVYAPVDKEITATDMPVIGQIPTDLDGVYVRNGHNPIFQ
ncbi:MAG: carotenoid oxygenase family protein, partial [Proteobacteria bacterium]|nr:carotenoid oxygenase family protein [Pseudomonadota bacterium]